MSPVHIDELNPETRARVLQQIGEAGGATTALALRPIEKSQGPAEPPKYGIFTPAEMRARSILSRIDSISAKLKTLEDDIRALWLDFDNLKPGETILGCRTKKEFCEKKLHRTPQAIRYMLNPELRESKQCLPPTPVPSPSPVPAESVQVPKLPQEPTPAEPAPQSAQTPAAQTKIHPLEEFQRHLSRLRPALIDHNSPKNQFVRTLDAARSTPIAADRKDLARIIVRMMRELSTELLAGADEIEEHISEAL